MRTKKKLSPLVQLKQRAALSSIGKQRGILRSLSVIWIIVQWVVEKIGRVGQKIFFLDQWFLMFDLSLSDSNSIPFHDFQKIIPPKDRFWADPHVIQVNEHYFVFVEEYIYRSRKAHISVIEINNEGNYKAPVKVLETGYHLSYPFVFECDGRYYMVPESSENKTIELYECVQFPNKWQRMMNLMENVSAVDTTLFHYGDKWWLFTGMQEDEKSLPLAKLYLFSSSWLFTKEWISHPLNPIEADVTRARPAGKLFIKEGRIFRPSQKCTRTYGEGFYINEVLRLSESDYSEKTVATVTPYWDRKILGSHTYVREGQLTLIDTFTRRRRIL